MQGDEKLFGFGWKLLNLLFSDPQENLQSVDLFFVDFWDYTGQNDSQKNQKNNPNNKHDHLIVYVLLDQWQDLHFSQFNLVIHFVSGDIAV